MLQRECSAVTERKLRVLSIAHTAVSRSAGRLRYHHLAEHDDMEVHLVVPARWKQFGRILEADPADDPGVTVHILPILFPHAGPMSWYLHVYRRLAALIGTIKPDVVHLWEEPWSLVAVQACTLKGQAALVLEVDQNILKRLPPPFETIRRQVLRRVDYILSRSSDATMVVRATGYTGPVSPIGYGVDEEVFHVRDGSDRASGGSALVLGYVGRLIEEKGLQDALDAMARSRTNMVINVMGEGPYEADLRQKAETLRLSDRFNIQPWGKPAAVGDFMRGLDALLLLTRSTPKVKEQFGRVIIEAQSCGVPVIGATSGAIPDVVGAGGWIVPESDPTALGALLDRIAADPEDRKARALAGLENVRARFTYAAIASQLADAWKSAARTKQPSHRQASGM